MNSGEGGLLVTDDDDMAAQAVLYSGSYMLYETHLARPPLEVFERHKKTTPNFSLRMSNLQAAILRPQLQDLETNCQRWNERYQVLETEMQNIPRLLIPPRSPREQYVASSMQFTLIDVSREQVETFLSKCKSHGVEIKWFGRNEPHGFTSTFESWQYLDSSPELPRTKKITEFLCDFRIPLTFSLEDCRTVALVIKESLHSVVS
jgi:dTDP-4-amino-4,6-dideoxygalactose transaminase